MRPIVLLLLAACESGAITIEGGSVPAELADSIEPVETDRPAELVEPVADTGDLDDTDTVFLVAPAVRCFDRGGGRFDRVVTATVPTPVGLDWTRVQSPRVLAWRASETCWDDQVPWSAGETSTGTRPDGVPGATYTLTVTTYGDACHVDLHVQLAWTADVHEGAPVTYATTGDTEPRCS